MAENTLHIKNMVCPRCISAVQNTLNELNIAFDKIELGQVSLKKAISSEQRMELSHKLASQGFELLESVKSSLISSIKSLIIAQIHHSETALSENFSSYIANQLNHEYSYLSRLFSGVEGITIEKFIAQQKIEKVKELLFYNELSLSEIAFRMQYSSVAYLSTQFKKETGMTPTDFRKMKKPGHKRIDGI
ncbi:AraC family transcriptional regulator [Roseivirga pacifica]|uniref:Transcriptional regulator, AraC family n=1 Tax=Roseivirga pacifica TaxID=1267423 RepID=A0A1I0Q666_9BACT|nr:helix-turn-helix transcriptional regulator [Roseivirga pacifica]RKQ43203.1 AraC family transcriptional regulator [Roseivirga pacifica]SEW22480.1 transcriptional regulator, AraC family [Roseivirga pacifica]